MVVVVGCEPVQCLQLLLRPTNEHLRPRIATQTTPDGCRHYSKSLKVQGTSIISSQRHVSSIFVKINLVGLD